MSYSSSEICADVASLTPFQGTTAEDVAKWVKHTIDTEERTQPRSRFIQESRGSRPLLQLQKNNKRGWGLR